MSKKVLFLSPYPEGMAASQRLKYEQYFDYFKENGYELHTSSFVSPPFWKIIYKKGHYLQKALYTISGYLRRTRDLFIVRQYDIVYVHLWVTPLGPPVFERLIGTLAKKLVYDIDDMIHISPGSAINQLISILKGKRKAVALMKVADHVITCTPDLNDFARQYCDACTDISSTLDTDRMQPAYRYNNDQPVVIGWTGTHTTAPFLAVIHPMLQRLATLRKYKLLIIGNFDFHLEGVDYQYIPWTKEHEVEDLQKMDIGVYPLPIEEWVMGKSGLKALQYMTFALPTVATNVGNAITRIIVDGRNGYLVRTDDEWIEKLCYLIDNPSERERLGRAGRQTVLENFSIAANKNKYLQILQSLN